MLINKILKEARSSFKTLISWNSIVKRTQKSVATADTTKKKIELCYNLVFLLKFGTRREISLEPFLNFNSFMMEVLII